MFVFGNNNNRVEGRGWGWSLGDAKLGREARQIPVVDVGEELAPAHQVEDHAQRRPNVVRHDAARALARLLVQRRHQVLAGFAVHAQVDAGHGQVVARSDEARRQFQRLVVGLDRLLRPAAVGQRRPQPVPQQSVLKIHFPLVTHSQTRHYYRNSLAPTSDNESFLVLEGFNKCKDTFLEQISVENMSTLRRCRVEVDALAFQ